MYDVVHPLLAYLSRMRSNAGNGSKYLMSANTGILPAILREGSVRARCSWLTGRNGAGTGHVKIQWSESGRPCEQEWRGERGYRKRWSGRERKFPPLPQSRSVHMLCLGLKWARTELAKRFGSCETVKTVNNFKCYISNELEKENSN